MVPDVAGELPGRGLWILPTREVIDRAGKKNLFRRAAKANIRVAGDLADQAEALMRKRCLESLGLARRVGQLAAGYEKAKACLEGIKPALLVQAQDASAEGRRKLAALAGHRSVPVMDDLFTRAELGRALGLAETVHAVLASGRLASRFLADALRLRRLRGLPEGREMTPEAEGRAFLREVSV